MRLAWATDVHLDSVDIDTAKAFFAIVKRSGAGALLLTGDIAEAHSLVRWLRFLHTQLELPIHFVLGNHDYYGGRIAAVRHAVSELETLELSYLPAVGPLQLTPEVALVGHDGWGDCRIGDLENFEILSDYFAIGDLSHTVEIGTLAEHGIVRGKLREKLQALGDEAAESLAPHLREAARTSKSILVLTHVPPFRQSCWYRGSISGETWLPGFTCKAMGDLLLEVANEFAGRQFVVLCGHTHGFGYARILPNLEVHTGFGNYGELALGLVDIDGAAVRVQRPEAPPAAGKLQQ